ncbi:ferroxidase fet3 [Coemansia spiralis]|uniref:Ferroxidase fet3 n=2 Tax=Coemansia TaxID=4863 RepID=A0A9W8G4F4_9FUNG|nr:ferroxidase fet3 [Coemansia umbellata]KAJ2619493.1 ferroxidase fet3 [Coemansia sp. RSA 1358]KAJ2671476.1 ferroxidase fet3 [Coemansia spiralis]
MITYTHAILFLLLNICLAARIELDWDVGYMMVNRDGFGTRRAIGINGKLPIPAVYITQGDTLAINVHNSLDVPTTIHIHGIFQNKTAYNDGPGMVTQCPIPSGANYTYEVTPEQQGTYWIHGHYLHQNTDGFRLPFVIKDATPIADYDEEYLISLEDWYLTEFADRMHEVLDPKVPFPPPPSFPTGLINGYNGNDTQVIKFTPGKRYRIRVVNMSTTEWFKFVMPGHRMQIIEVEGIRSVPQYVDGLDMGPGQRYSFIVTAHKTDQYNYIYNATLYANFVPAIMGLNPRFYTGLIEYRSGAPLYTQTASSDHDIEWADDIKLSSFDNEPLLGPVSRKILLTVTSRQYADGITRGVLGTLPYNATGVPPLFTALTMGRLAMSPLVYGPQAQVYVLDHMDVIEIELHNPTLIDHPFHLHGHVFQVVEYGPSELSQLPPKFPVRRAVGPPIKRDTLVVRVGEYIKVRFRADSPGVWLFHCHMDVHFMLGTAITFVEAPLLLQKQTTVPESLIQMCLSQGIKVSGNAAGNEGYDLTGLPLAPVP